MKKIVLLMLLAFGYPPLLQAQPNSIRPGPNILNQTDFSARPQVILSDPWRIINGETQKVDQSWVAVSGQVVQVHPGEGLRVEGSIEGVRQSSDFFVVHLPVSAAENELLPPRGYVLLVKDVGTYTYTTALGSSRTIRKYDYGIPWTPPPPAPLTSEQIAALKKNAFEKVLASDKAAAERDEPGGLERMADRYRTGNGVQTNLIIARMYLLRAMEGGSLTASNKLAQLTPAADTK